MSNYGSIAARVDASMLQQSTRACVGGHCDDDGHCPRHARFDADRYIALTTRWRASEARKMLRALDELAERRDLIGNPEQLRRGVAAWGDREWTVVCSRAEARDTRNHRSAVIRLLETRERYLFDLKLSGEDYPAERMREIAALQYEGRDDEARKLVDARLLDNKAATQAAVRWHMAANVPEFPVGSRWD
jgi:hypothetical protein